MKELHEVELEVIKPAPEDDGKTYPKGFAKEHSTIVIFKIEAENLEEVKILAINKAKKEFKDNISKNKYKIKKIKQIKRAKPGFKQKNIEEHKRPEAPRAQADKPRTEGKKPKD